MPHPEITLATETIHNPAEPRHYMRFRPITAEVVDRAGGVELARSNKAMRMLEVARDVYDAVLYVPLDSISNELKPVPDKTTHCPLKGDASYFALAGKNPGDPIEPIAWTYQTTFEFAEAINGYVAFYADQVSIEEIGIKAAN